MAGRMACSAYFIIRIIQVMMVLSLNFFYEMQLPRENYLCNFKSRSCNTNIAAYDSEVGRLTLIGRKAREVGHGLY